MVTSVNTRVGQDCKEWIDALRTNRSQLTEQRNSLMSLVANRQISHDALPVVDHFENQFDIQLSNVNQLKHAIKEHLHTLESTPSQQLSAPHFTVHESLSDQFQGLSATIEKLSQAYAEFNKSL